MAITVDATIGGLNSNSYLTVARASQLAETMPHMGEWFTETTINKPQILVHATRMIDLNFVPKGRKGSDAQSLWWPQTGIRYADTTITIPSSIIPIFVEYATMEWAWALYQNPDPYAEIAPGIREIYSPSYRVEFTGNDQSIVPRVVSELLLPYCERRLKSWVRVVRV